jgi:hypothetical protein
MNRSHPCQRPQAQERRQLPRFGKYLAAERFAHGKGSDLREDHAFSICSCPIASLVYAQEFPTAALCVLDERYGFRKLRNSRTCCRGGRGWLGSLSLEFIRDRQPSRPSSPS